MIDLNKVDPDNQKEVDVELSLTTDGQYAVVIDGKVVGIMKKETSLKVHERFRSFRVHIHQLWDEIPGLVDVTRNSGKSTVRTHYAMRFTRPVEVNHQKGG